MESVTINVNQRVRFKMRDRGWEAYRKYFAETGAPMGVLEVDEDGYSEMQLWELMLIIGPAMHMGPMPPIETTIEILF